MKYNMHDWLATSSLGAASEDFLQQFSFEERVHKAKKNNEICPLRLEKWINYYRQNGHFYAKINPLENPPQLDDFNPQYFDIPQNWLSSNTTITGVFGREIALNQLENQLQNIYCHHLGVEFGHIADNKIRQWFINELEKEQQTFTVEEQKSFYAQLVEAEGLERYLGAKFPGAKRFSLEGSDAFMVLMHEIIRYGKKCDIDEIVFGMAHRGRLNMLVNIFGKPPFELFDEFEGKSSCDDLCLNELSGDVKYHQGRKACYQTNDGVVNLSLAFNPSHLEIVSPVVQGMTRAKQDGKANRHQVLAVTVHGDSAVTGQGIVQESLNMSNTRGFSVNGTIRVVINNQVGFTTSNPKDTRSTHYCTAIAKMIDAPILHVNGDDPEAVAFAAHMAVNYRQQFHQDIFIELLAYRRLGHNEADEPSLTQPLMYQKIKKHPTVVSIYGEKLAQHGVMNFNEQQELQKNYRKQLESNQQPTTYHQRNDDYKNIDIGKNDFSVNDLQKIGKKLITRPKDFPLHSRLEKVLNDRNAMLLAEKPLDWGMAESLAFASLLNQGVSIRLTGEDAGRGTFSHRHAVFHHQQENLHYTPLKQCENQSHFEVWDSVLTERAVLAFEYGYALTKPKTLTLWEAQFGDFANVAQDVIDQFIASSEQKWGISCGLTMLLPHGYEGQGPEHSSARLERYLQLCGQDNLRVCVPTTPAQIFHLLRQQALKTTKVCPLIVMSPKSLLRHPKAVSNLTELTSNLEFKTVLVDDVQGEVDRIIFCSGKVYYDLKETQQKYAKTNTLIVRLEQLYPFPSQEVEQILQNYSANIPVYWVQEEPQNQGAWNFVYMEFLKTGFNSLQYIGRPSMAATAEGNGTHNKNQQKIINMALNLCPENR